jgi:hypothetical protein
VRQDSRRKPSVSPITEKAKPGGRIPDLHGLIFNSRGKTAAVRTVRHAPDGARVSFEG